MIKYIHDKEIYGPYMEKTSVIMPERAEVGSTKYTNMRYDDKTNANMELDDFLIKAYAKQIKELNSSTAMARVTMTRAAVSNRQSAHSPLDNVTTQYNPVRLLKGAPPGQDKVNFYASELNITRMNREKQRKSNFDHLFKIQAFGDYDSSQFLRRCSQPKYEILGQRTDPKLHQGYVNKKKTNFFFYKKP